MAQEELRVWDIEVPGAWTAASELNICLAQPTQVAPDVIAADAARPGSLELARALFERVGGRSTLERWFADQPGLLLFPEYAFSSTDFGHLKLLLESYPQPLVLVAGFGAVRGDALIDLLQQCAPTWPGGPDLVDVQARYNGAWIVVRNHGGEIVAHTS